MPPKKQVEVLLKAERDGPGAHDTAEWLVAQAAAEAAERIEAAVKKAGRDEQFDRIEEQQKQQALVFAAVGYGRLAPPVFDRIGMFVLGLSATAFALLWLWLYRIIKATRP